jgi:gluconolactonase
MRSSATATCILFLAAANSLPGCAQPSNVGYWVESFHAPYPTLGKIDRKNPRLDKIIAPDAKIEKLASGMTWCEGPVWIKSGGYLLFSDIPLNRVLMWKEGAGVSVYLEKSGFDGSFPRPGHFKPDEPGCNGLVLDPDGRLILMQHGNRRVAVQNKPGEAPVALVDKYEGKRFNSPNDGAYNKNGDLYFTDPPYGLTQKEKDKEKELSFQGVYRRSKDGKLTLLHKDMTRPNGIAFSPDEKTLYVANSDPDQAIWMAFPVKDDGTLGEGKVFFDATPWAKEGRPGLPDGLKVDKDGNLYATGPGGVIIFAPDGTHLGTIDTGERTSNVGWGDDGSTLYITADMFVLRVKTATKGKGW